MLRGLNVGFLGDHTKLANSLSAAYELFFEGVIPKHYLFYKIQTWKQFEIKSFSNAANNKEAKLVIKLIHEFREKTPSIIGMLQRKSQTSLSPGDNKIYFIEVELLCRSALSSRACFDLFNPKQATLFHLVTGVI